MEKEQLKQTMTEMFDLIEQRKKIDSEIKEKQDLITAEMKVLEISNIQMPAKNAQCVLIKRVNTKWDKSIIVASVDKDTLAKITKIDGSAVEVMIRNCTDEQLRDALLSAKSVKEGSEYFATKPMAIKKDEEA